MADTVNCTRCRHAIDADILICPYCYLVRGEDEEGASTPDLPVTQPAARPRPNPPQPPAIDAAQIPLPRSRHRTTVEVTGGCVLRVGASGDPIRINANEPVLLGRESPHALISEALDDYHEVSREHAVIVASRGKVEVTDKGSMNGTRVAQVDLAAGGSLVADLPVTIRLGDVCDVRLDLPG